MDSAPQIRATTPSARAVIYARYSSENQRDASIEDQLRVCRARAEREGWSIVQVYSDHAISGATTLRPGFQSLLANIRAGKADVVLAESLDRFSRDQEHIAAFFKQVSFAETRIVTLSEGEVSELHIGLKGTMGALYLKELAEKTRRGLEGRIRAGRSIGRAAYGYRRVPRLNDQNEPDRGLRAIDPCEGAIVLRIFKEYASGFSPVRIARTLNAEGVPGPSGGPWYESTIRGRPLRGDGLLRNPIYIGQLVWNRRRNMKDPITGHVRRRPNDCSAVISHDVPGLRIVDEALWARVQLCLERERLPARKASGEAANVGFQEHRRPRHLLTKKVFCGCCGRTFAVLGKDYLGCLAARHGVCRNTVRIRRQVLEAEVVDALGSRLMHPELVAAFIDEFIAEWNRRSSEAASAGESRQRELQTVQRKLTNLVDAIADGLRAPGLQSGLDELEGRRSALLAELARSSAPAPVLHPNIGNLYR
jgi:site-specific DNA recombinase